MNPFEVFQNASMLHSLSVHFPVALSMLGVPLLVVCVLTQMQKPAWRWVAFVLYALVAATAFGAVLTGENALNAVPGINALPQDVQHRIESHQWFAEMIWILASATAVCIVFCTVKKEWFRATFAILALLGGLVTAGWTGFTSFHGMALVYHDGIGTASFHAEPAKLAPVVPGVEPDKKPAPELDPLAPPAQKAPAPLSDGLKEPAAQKPPEPRPGYTSRMGSFFKNVKNALWP